MWRSSAAAAASASPSRIASWIAVLGVDRRCRLLRSWEGRFIPEIAPADDGVLVGNAAHFSRPVDSWGATTGQLLQRTADRLRAGARDRSLRVSGPGRGARGR